MTNKFYDRQGKEISVLECNDLKSQKNYCLLKRDLTKGMHISTVWLGDAFEDIGITISQPRIFGTGIFSLQPHAMIAEIRHTTETEALERHAILLKAIEDGNLDEVMQTLEENRVQ